MSTVAIICEFNPFHDGHKLILNKAHELFPDSKVIAIMSGNTVQRGEFAVFDKYIRGKIAVSFGYDLVLEIPFPFSSSCGEQFANAAVYIAEKIGADYLLFGSENGEISELSEIAYNLCNPEFKKNVENLRKSERNLSVIKAKEQIYTEMFGGNLPKKSNDILGIEYLSTILEKGYKIKPFTFRRLAGSTASSARENLKSDFESSVKKYLPENISDIPPFNYGLESISDLILGNLRLDYGSDDGSGLINLFKSCAIKARDFSEFLDLLPTKIYTKARLRREIIGYLTGITDRERNETPFFTVLLSANQKGLSYLSEIRKSCTLPVLTKNSDSHILKGNALAQFEKSKIMDSIYVLGFNPKHRFEPFRVPFIKK